MENVLVFATSVESPLGISDLAPSLDQVAGKGRWNFDLHDCDRILRVTSGCQADDVIDLLESAGYNCVELSDEIPLIDWRENNRLAS